LTTLGYEVIEAGTGREALTLAKKLVPALILLDLGLPDVDGLSIAKKLREKPETAGIVIAALTAEEIAGPRAEEVFKHCIGYIPKPVGLSRLAQHVALFLRLGRSPEKVLPERAMTDDHPRRRHPRFNVEIGVICRIRGGGNQPAGSKVAGIVRNLSEGGLMVELPEMCIKGATVEVTLRTDDARVQTLAEIVWAGAPENVKGGGRVYRHGVKFIRMPTEQRNAIRRFIVKRFTA
jgi:CheY-like chemotaxis protein